jgi:hypothetical protein
MKFARKWESCVATLISVAPASGLKILIFDALCFQSFQGQCPKNGALLNDGVSKLTKLQL